MTRTAAALAVVALVGPALPAQQAKTPATAVARPAQPPRPAPAQPVRPAMPLALPAVDVADAFGAQFAPQFTVLHKAELRFLKAVCEPTPEQYAKIAADGEAAVKAAAQEYGRANQNGMATDTDPRRSLSAAVLQSARAHLTPEQVAKYQKETDLRAAARKRMIVANLVVMVDNALILSADQRAKLAEVLAANWNTAWNQPMYFSTGGRYFPPMPDAKLREVLTDAQRAVWDGIPKGNVRFGVNLNVPQWADPGDDESAAPPAKKEAGKK